MLTPKQQQQVRELHQIIMETAAKHNISTEQLIAHNRRAGITWARFEVMWRARREAGMAYKLIARVLGNRDHATIIYGVKRYESWRDNGTLDRSAL